MFEKYDYILDLHKRKKTFLDSINIKEYKSYFFDKDSFKRRVLQIISTNTTYFEDEEYIVQLKKISRLKKIFSNVLYFFFRSFKNLLYSFYKGDQEKISVINCYGFEYLLDKNLNEMEDFFLDISSRWNSKLAIGLKTNLTTKDQRIFFSNDSYKLLYSKIPLFSFERVKLIFYFCIATFEYLKLTFKNPLFSYLEKDYAMVPIIRVLNNLNLLYKFAVTTSEYNVQLLPFSDLKNKKFEFHYINYSVNHFSLPSKKVETVVEHSAYYFLKCDVAWCWNQFQADWMRRITQAKSTFISGPVLFIKHSGRLEKNKKEKEKIVFFDVTPQNEDWFKRTIGRDGDYFYYSKHNCMKFLKDIERIAIDNPENNFYIKTKRDFNKNHCKEYIALMKRITRDNLNFLEPGINLLDELQDVDKVISIPFSSPSFLGEYLKIASAFYDPSGTLSNVINVESPKFLNDIKSLDLFIKDIK